MHGPQTAVRAPGSPVLAEPVPAGRWLPDWSRDETQAPQYQYHAVHGILDRVTTLRPSGVPPSWEVRIESLPRPTLGLDHGFCSVQYHLLSEEQHVSQAAILTSNPEIQGLW